MKIAILYICTGKYNQFFDGFYHSCEELFLKNQARKEYFVFTDDMSLSQADNVHLFRRECQGFPMDSLLRFDIFLQVKQQLLNCDYTLFFNANALFVRPTGMELLPSEGDGLVAGVWKRNLNAPMFYPYERNKRSTAYIPPRQGPYKYYGGFFNGGKTIPFVTMAEELANNTRIDLERGIIARVHDESHLNSYLHQHGCTALPKEYIIPEEFLKPTDTPYVVLRDKVRLDPYFNKGRKHGYWAKILKGYQYIKNAVIWYL